ncbi:unnamed protein product [Urochloa humidicola]
MDLVLPRLSPPLLPPPLRHLAGLSALAEKEPVPVSSMKAAAAMLPRGRPVRSMPVGSATSRLECEAPHLAWWDPRGQAHREGRHAVLAVARW